MKNEPNEFSVFDTQIHPEEGEDDSRDDFFDRFPREEIDPDPEPEREPPEDGFRNDVEADADALASAGLGTDEDYGYFGGEEF